MNIANPLSQLTNYLIDLIVNKCICVYTCLS